MRTIQLSFLLLSLFSFSTFAQSDTWTIDANTIDPAHYYGVTVANGMIGLVSSPEPFLKKLF